MHAMTSMVCVCLLVLSASVAASESDTDPQPTERAATDTADNRQKADEKQKDIFDRVFSPLDNAVSDINRDLNKGDGSAAPMSSE